MTTWILALTLLSNPNGTYVKEYSSEKECVVAMKQFINTNQDNDNVKSIACFNTNLLASNEE